LHKAAYVAQDDLSRKHTFEFCGSCVGASGGYTQREGMTRRLHEFTVRTPERECLVEVTPRVAQAVRSSGVRSGVALLYVPHTTCGLVIQENADPGVGHDILLLLRRIAPRGDPAYRHVEENTPAHLQSSLTGHATFVFVQDGELVLGRWQAIFLAEFDGPRTRTVLVKVLPDPP